MITHDELADPALAGCTVYEALQRLRPRFVNDRGGGLGGRKETPRVSINGSDLMAINELTRMNVLEVTEIRYLSVGDAGLRFGLRGSMGPVLLVTMAAR